MGRRFLLRAPGLVEGFQRAAAVVFQTSYQKMVYSSFTFDTSAEVHVLPFWNDAVYRQEIVPAPKQKIRILSVGIVAPNKRVHDTISAVELLSENLKREVECVFIGKYFELPQREREIVAAHPERYIFLGEQPNETTLNYLASADCFVLASSSESQPLSIWESFELEVPVCVSDLETYRHIGLKHGVNALMHPVGNVDILAENLRAILTNRSIRSSISRGAKGLLLRNLVKDWRNGFEDIIENVVARREIAKLGY